jgi:23S rRNA (cytosine1962-C5)-methyltransferase
MEEVRLLRGRARPLWAGHPDVLSGAVSAVTGSPGAGDVVLVRDHEGRPVGRGFFAPASPVRVRLLTREPEEEIDGAFFLRRARRAAALRASVGLPSAETTVYRAVHSAGDGLPGLVADRYGDFLVIEVSNRGMERRAEEIAASLAEAFGVRGARLAAVPASMEEGLNGEGRDLLPEPVPAEVEVRENGTRFFADTLHGQKTGHFADQRENRAAFARLAAGARVLDAFAGTGGFGLAAARAGAASVIGVDSSARALELAARNAAENGVSDRVSFVKDDVFRFLRRQERDGRRFDAIVLDPPRMASRRKEVHNAVRGYKELNLRAMRLLVPGGLLATSSCTGVLPEDDFFSIVRDAALDAKREAQLFFRSGQAPDHPWPAACPESRYLKFALARIH